MIRFEALEGRPPVTTLPRPVTIARPRTGRYMVGVAGTIGSVLLMVGGLLFLIPCLRT